MERGIMKIVELPTYAYTYVEVWWWQKTEQLSDFMKNVRWIKKYGVYRGDQSQ